MSEDEDLTWREQYRKNREREDAKRFDEHLVNWTIVALIPVVVVLFFVHLAFRLVTVEQHSMEPTLHDADKLLVDTWRARAGLPNRGAVVVFRKPGSGILVVKRVIGLPGDTIELGPAGVTVNGASIPEPYAAAYAFTRASATVPGDMFWVLGDNRSQSEDSRDYGPVPRDRMYGTALMVVQPWSQRRSLSNPQG